MYFSKDAIVTPRDKKTTRIAMIISDTGWGLGYKRFYVRHNDRVWFDPLFSEHRRDLNGGARNSVVKRVELRECARHATLITPRN